MKLPFLLITLCAAASALAQDHGHLAIGATNTAPGTPLYFYNGSLFTESSGYVKTLFYTNANRFAGYHQGNITPTVQAATTNFSGPEIHAPALGTYVVLTILRVQGPPGGAFGFWENGATSPTLSIPSGGTNATSYRITQTSGAPGDDPFGHIHGRRFTATKPGLYTVTFRAHDASTNGPGGGPIHAPSPEINIVFQAGVNLVSVDPVGEFGYPVIRFGAALTFDWQLEFTAQLGTNIQWHPVGTPITGQDYFVDVIHDIPPSPRRFYRLVGTLTP